jgi:hypothetical protein
MLKAVPEERPMTEAEWLACDDPRLMLQALHGKTSRRRLFQFAAFCWRRGSRFLENDASRRGVEALESLANGEPIDDRDLRWTEDGDFLICLKDINYCIGVSREPEYALAAAVGAVEAVAIAEATEAGDSLAAVAAMVPADSTATAEWEDARRGLSAALHHHRPLVLEFFGNPFRPVAFDPAWRTDTAVSLARTIYDAGDFSAMPILADALQDAGCDNNDILNHCRGDGAHVRGCWVIDLVLGKE